MIRKVSAILLVVLILTALFSACRGYDKSNENVEYETTIAATTTGGPGFSGGGYGTKDDYGKDSSDEYTENNSDEFRKIIKTGEIAVEVEDVEGTYRKVADIVRQLGGYEFSKDYNARSEYKRMHLVYKIPPENLDVFQDRLEELVGSGNIKSSGIRSNDITSQYYDAQSRLDSYIASRDQYREILKKAEKIEDILKVQNEITRIQADIDSLQGMINMWDKLVSFATITLYIDQKADPMKHTKTVTWDFHSADDIWRNMKNGFIATVNTLFNVVAWLCIIIVSLLPVIIPAGVITFIIINVRRKNRNKNQQL